MVLFALFFSEAHIKKKELFSQVIEKKEKKPSENNSFRTLISKLKHLRRLLLDLYLKKQISK